MAKQYVEYKGEPIYYNDRYFEDDEYFWEYYEGFQSVLDSLAPVERHAVIVNKVVSYRQIIRREPWFTSSLPQKKRY